MIKEIGNRIWTIDGPEVVFAGAAMGTRMTLVQLSDGGLWVHSPVALSADISAFVDSLGGEVRALVAPNKFHHLFVAQWRERYPGAQVFAAEELLTKVKELASAEVLGDQPAALYGADLDQLVFTGNRMFSEVVFFHKTSGTVIFTDLLINLSIEDANWIARLFYRFEQVVYPDGGVPRLYRLLTSDRSAARRAVEQILEWQPRQLVFSHGGPFGGEEVRGDAVSALLRDKFAWLLK